MQKQTPAGLEGYDVGAIIAKVVASCDCCEHGVSLLAPCEPCQRVDMLAGYFVGFTVTEDERGG